MRPELSDFGFTVCYSNLVFLFDANACSWSQMLVLGHNVSIPE